MSILLIDLETNIIFGLELVVLHTRFFIFSAFSGACLETVWRFEQKNNLYCFIRGTASFENLLHKALEQIEEKRKLDQKCNK